MKLTKKEEAWFARLEKCLAAAPESLRKKDGKKIRSFTIGDRSVVVYDAAKVDKWVENQGYYTWNIPDVTCIVDKSESELLSLSLPFCVESTAG